MDAQRKREGNRIWRRTRWAALGLAVVVGLLLWGRLIVISRMPRQAVAEERDKGTEGQRD
jgi:hypothetical protein